jgi:E1A/CREB-binding protein
MLTGVFIVCWQDIWKDAVDNEMASVTEMPYFEGDFWPNILEECIKEIEQEEMEKRRREEEEAAADTDDGESSVHADGVEVCILLQ